MSFQERFRESPLRQKWRPELSTTKSKNTKKRRRRNKSQSGRADDFGIGLDNLQDISEGSTVLQRAIMYQMEQKLPKLSSVKSTRKKKEKSKKRNRVTKDDKSMSHKIVNDESSKSLLPLESLPGTKNFDAPSTFLGETGNDLEKHQVTEDMGSPPRSIMSKLPEAPNLHAIKSMSLKKTKTLTRGRNKKEPVSTDTFLDQMDEYVDINPKYGSPFAPEKMNKYVAKVDRVTLFSFDSDRAALDEFTSLNKKSLIIFGGFGLAREKPGGGRSGWRSIWETSAMYTGAKAIPRESIERTEGCNYFCGEVYSMSLARRPKWSKIKSSVAKHERLDAHTVIGDDAQLARSSHSTVLVKGSYLFVFGGKQRGNIAGGDPSPLNDVRWLDLRTRPRLWRVGNVTGTIPSRRWGHCACMVENKMYVVGGIAGGTPFTRWNPYLDVSHNSSVPRRRNAASKSSPPKKKDNKLFPDAAPTAKNAAPQLFACLDTNSMKWIVPAVVSHDMPGAPSLSNIKQVKHSKIPYAMYGHSMTIVNAWGRNVDMSTTNYACDGTDLYLFGGWEWFTDNEFGENLSGPILSERLTLFRVGNNQNFTASSWGEIVPKSMHRSPGPRANHTAFSHSAGLFIFGGRRLKNGQIQPNEDGKSKDDRGRGNDSMTRRKKKRKGKKDAHQKMVIVDLEYLNDLCLLINEKTGDSDTTSWSWVQVDVRGKLPRPRESASMTNVYNKSILMFGGYSGEPGKLPPADEPIANRLPGAEPHPWLNDFFVLRVDGTGRDVVATWTQVLAPGAPSPRSGCEGLIVDMARAEAKNCVVLGDGLQRSYVGEKSIFSIRAYDDTGERRWCGRDSFQVVLEGPWEKKYLYVDEEGITRVRIDERGKKPANVNVNAILAFVEDNNDGSYTCSYAPLLAGFYSVEIRCNGDEIDGSPFSMWAKAGKPVANKSKIRSINGLECEDSKTTKVRAGEKVYIDVDAADKFGNARHEDEDAALLKVYCINLTDDLDSTAKDALFWESMTLKTTLQIQNSFNLMWKERMIEYAKGIVAYLCFMTDDVDENFLCIENVSRSGIEGMATFKEGHASMQAMKRYFGKSRQQEVSKNGEATIDKSKSHERSNLIEIYHAGKLIGDRYTIVRVYGKSEDSYISNTKKHATTSCCSSYEFLYHIYCIDTQETYALRADQESIINIIRQQWDSDVPEHNSMSTNTAIVPSATYGSFLNAANQSMFKGHLNVPRCKGPCMVAVLLNGMHIGCSPIKLMSFPGLACQNLSYAVKLFEEDSFPVGEERIVKIVAIDESRLQCVNEENCFEVEVIRQDERLSDTVANPIQSPITYQGSGVYIAKISNIKVGNWLVQVYYNGTNSVSKKDRQEIHGSGFTFSTKASSVCSSNCIVTNIDLFSHLKNDMSELSASVWKQIQRCRLPLVDDYILRMSHDKAATIVEAGTEYAFNIQARDKYGNLVASPETFQVKLVSHDRRTIVNGHVVGVQANPSMYVGKFTPQRATFYNIHIMYGHDHILGSPSNILVCPSHSDSKTSSIIRSDLYPISQTKCGETKSIKIIIRDRFLNRKGEGEQIKCSMIWPSDNPLDAHEEKCDVKYSDTGAYICTYGSKKAGKYILRILLGDEHIIGSPVYGEIRADPADISMCEMMTTNNVNGPEKKDIFVGQNNQLKLFMGTKSAWTILEKDRHGNRRESCSLSLKCKLKVKEWDQDPYELRKEAIAQDRRRFQDMVEGLKDQQNKKKQREKEIEEAWNIVREKRRAHFEKHVEREMKKQYMSVCKSVIEAITVAIEEGNQAYKDTDAPGNWLYKLYDSSYKHKPPAVKFYPKFKADHTFDVEIPSEILNERQVQDNINEQGEYQIPLHLQTEITDTCDGDITVKGNGIYHLTVELEPHMIGRGELCIIDEESSTHIQGSPFQVQMLPSNTEKINVISLLGCIKVEQLEAFDRYTGIPIIVNVKNNSTTKFENFENRYIRSILSASILPLPNEGKIVDVGNESLPELDVGKTRGAPFPPPDGNGILSMPSHLELEYGDSANDANAKIRYVTTRNGKFELSVKLANVHIKGSPFNLTVLGSKASAKRCLISGIGTQNAEITKRASFTFYACDKFGNRRIRGGDNISGKLVPFSESLLHSQINSEEKGTVDLDVHDNQDGTYTCYYEPKVAGWNRLLLLCNESEVFGTDELRTNKVYVKPGPLDSTKCRVRIVTTSKEVTGDQPLSAIQLLDDTNVSSQAGSTLRIVIASRDRLGNDRRGKEFLEDADLFQIRIRRTDSLQIKEPTISLVPMHDKNGMDTGQYHGILVLESVGTYTVDVTVAEYTTTRLGRWGVVRPVTKDSISIVVKPGKCYPAASTLTRLTEHGSIEVTYNMDLDTCDAYASVARKDILKAGTSGQTESLQKKFWFGPFAQARASVDISYHGVYLRSRQHLQDQIIHNIVSNGIPTSKPVFLLIVGGLGAGKHHTLRSLNRYGRFPLDAFVWIDTQQIIQQIPETKILLHDASKKIHVVNRTRKEAGFIAEVAIREAMSCKKCIAYSTSLASSEWITEWVTGLKNEFSEYAFLTIHVIAPKDDVMMRALEVKRLRDIYISDEDILLSTERSNEEFNNICTMDIWQYYGVIRNANSKLAEDGYTILNTPEIIQEGGTQAYSVQVAPSTIGDDDIKAAEYEQRATIEQLSGEKGIQMPLDSPKHVVSLDDLEDARVWKTFCSQFDAITQGIKFVNDNFTTPRPKVQIARNIHMPRLMLSAGEPCYFAITTRDAFENLRLGDNENISITLVRKADVESEFVNDSRNASQDEVSTEVVAYPEEGRYVCSYSSNKSGDYILSMFCSGQHICGSPYDIKVLPGRVHYRNCIAYGPLFSHELLSAQVTNFTIVARDKYGNRIRRGGDKFSVFCDYSDENERHSLKGEILDRGDGRHEVKVRIPAKCSEEMIVTIKDFEGSTELKSSPYKVSVKHISKLDLKSAYFDSVICSSVPPEAGTLLRIPIYIPASGLASKISLSVVPFSSVLEEQKLFSSDHVRYVVEESSKHRYSILFRVIHFDPSVKLQVLVSCYGSQIRAADGIGLLPTLSATTTDPKYCIAQQSLGPSASGLKYAFAGGQVNAFRIQAYDRFGNKKTTGGDHFRVRIISPIEESLNMFYVANGVYECKYTLPYLLGSMSHGNNLYPQQVTISVEFFDRLAMESMMPSQVDLEVEDGEDDNQIWSHINGSPFTVPVSLPLSYILNVVEISEKKPIQNARFRIWRGTGGDGENILAGRVGIDGGILIGDARQWKTGFYTVEVEALNYFPSRFSVYVPPPTKSSLKSLDDELTLLASKIPKEDVESDEIVMQAPNFEYNSNKTEIPTLRVLKQGDIDLEDQGLKPQHVWWFAKKGNEIAAVMNEDGSLTELTLEMCEMAFGKNPKPEVRLPTNYKQYLHLRNEYDKAYQEVETAMESINISADENRPNTSVDFAKSFMTPLRLFLIKKTDEGYPLTFVLQWHQKIPLILKWNVEVATVKHNNNVQKDGVYARLKNDYAKSPDAEHMEIISLNSSTSSIASLSVIPIDNEIERSDHNQLKSSLATVRIYHLGQLMKTLCISYAKWISTTGSIWKIAQFNSEGEVAIVDTVASGMEMQEVSKPEVGQETIIENDVSRESENSSHNTVLQLNQEEDDDYDDDYEDEEYEDDDWD